MIPSIHFQGKNPILQIGKAERQLIAPIDNPDALIHQIKQLTPNQQKKLVNRMDQTSLFDSEWDEGHLLETIHQVGLKSLNPFFVGQEVDRQLAEECEKLGGDPESMPMKRWFELEARINPAALNRKKMFKKMEAEFPNMDVTLLAISTWKKFT